MKTLSAVLVAALLLVCAYAAGKRQGANDTTYQAGFNACMEQF